MTTRKLKFSGVAGMLVRAVFTNRLTNDVWNGEELVTYDDADFDDYKVSGTELGHGNYTFDIPDDFPAGQYHAAYYDNADDTDSIFQTNFDYDGATIVDDLVVGSSVANICNLALSHLGSGERIVNLETDVSEAAAALRDFYDITRDATLRDFTWPHARRYVSPGMIEEDPTEEWGYAFRYPSNALRIRRILGGGRNETPASRIPWEVGSDETGLILYTDVEEPEIEYTVRATNPLKYPPDYVLAFSYRLAHHIAPRITGTDPTKLGERALQLYALEIRKAAATASNEKGRELSPDSDMATGR